ncbi:hypothetical protein DRO97_04155 [Archaeoglobales archaeon]|nr:MAG: hypothetical protein DRO97_04155 [Archaeoglobales archaeon]
MWEINWDMFAAGLVLIALTLTMYIGVGLLSTFKVKIKIPWYIPLAMFLISVTIILEAVGLGTGLYSSLLESIKQANVYELVFGVIIVMIALYTPLLERLKLKLGGWVRLFIFIAGLLLILDATRILPTFYYLASIIETSLYVISSYIYAYPWLAGIIIIALILYATFVWLYVSKKGGVRV